MPTAAAAGGDVTVVAGDTLYGIARRHGVSISELMSVNGLSTPMIRPGQRLALPTGTRRPVKGRSQPTDVAAAPIGNVRPTRAPAQIPVSAPPAGEPSDWTGTHTVSPRNSLYAIAREHNVRVGELQRVNGITDPTKLRAGTVLKVPGQPGAGPSTPEPTTVAAPPLIPPLDTPKRGDRPNGLRDTAEARGGETQVAGLAPKFKVLNNSSQSVTPRTVQPTTISVPKTATPTAPEDKSPSGKFRWPAKGRIIARFGPRRDNTRNDGINILVPQGSDVHAAEDGTVAYAGDELKGYGNLVLIRHTGNWVSAYAHNETLLVKRGDKVQRGQPIAKAGKTGAVDQPQVHFELRQGSKPIDPMPHLEK